jgi:hypothetical protein
MAPLDSVGKTLMMFGVILLVIGAIMHFGGKFTSLGRLPGDINFEKENFSVHFPIVTSILISIIATIVWNLFSRR